MESLEKLCKIVEKRLDKAVDALEREGGKLSAADADYLDKLTHTMKSIKTTLAMEGYGSSERRGRDSMGRYTSRDGGSYADGEGGYSNRYGWPMYAYDGGSYAEGGRSMHGDEREKLERMMRETSDENVRRALQEAMRKL